MPDTDDTYDKARDLAEKALDQYAHGNPEQGDKLAEKAVQIDRHAVEELVDDLDEDAKTTGAEGSGATGGRK